MRNAIRLSRLALAVVGRTRDLIRCLAAEAVERAPKVSCSRLIGDVPEHPDNFAALDLPEGLAAKLKVISLLVDRIAAAAIDQDASVDT